MTEVGNRAYQETPTLAELEDSAVRVYELLMRQRELSTGGDLDLLAQPFYSPGIYDPRIRPFSTLIYQVAPASPNFAAHMAVVAKRDAKTQAPWRKPPLFDLVLPDETGSTHFIATEGRVYGHEMLPDITARLRNGDPRNSILGEILRLSILRFSSRSIFEYLFKLVSHKQPE